MYIKFNVDVTTPPSNETGKKGDYVPQRTPEGGDGEENGNADKDKGSTGNADNSGTSDK